MFLYFTHAVYSLQCYYLPIPSESTSAAACVCVVGWCGVVCEGLAPLVCRVAGDSNNAAGAAGVAPAGERHGVVERHG